MHSTTSPLTRLLLLSLSVWLVAMVLVAAEPPAPAAAAPSVPKAEWSLKYVDSEETVGEPAYATKAFDGNPGSYWHTKWAGGAPAHPHEIQIDLGAVYDLDGFTYTPRTSGTVSVNGRIADYAFYVSVNGIDWGSSVSSGTFLNSATPQTRAFPVRSGRYIRLVALSEVNGGPWTAVGEIDVTGFPSTGGGDVTAPTWTAGTVSISNISSTGVTLAWSGATDDVGVTGYRVTETLEGLGTVATTAGTTTEATFGGLRPGTTHRFLVQAFDAAGNESANGPVVVATTLPAGGSDTTPPAWPGAALTATNVTQTSLDLSWTAATDAVGVAQYNIYRQGAGLIGTTLPTKRTLPVTGLAVDSSYTFTVQAVDAAGNESVTGPSRTAATIDEVVGGAGFQFVDVFTGLSKPVAMEFAANGDIFVAEKDGTLKVYDGVGDSNGPDVVLSWNNIIMANLDRGLLGLAVDPGYSNGRDWVYIFYTYDELPGGTNPPRWGDDCATWDTTGCTVTAKLSRIKVDPVTHAMVGPEQILMEHHWCMQFTSHSNDDLEFGPDGYLYVSAGEGASFTFVDQGQAAGNPCQDPAGQGGALRAQDLLTTVGSQSADPVSYSGSILRINPDTGAAVAGNPLVGKGVPGDDRIIAHGLRNPYRMAFRPGTNELWVGDVGWGTWEEINRIADVTDQVVENFQWPCYEGPGIHNGYAAIPLCNQIINGTLNPVVSTAMTPPHFAYNHGAALAGCNPNSGSITGLEFESASPYPAAYQDALFFGDYTRGCLWAMKKGSGGLPDPSKTELLGTGIKVTDLEIGPGGELYIVDPVSIFQNGVGRIRRLKYSGANGAPAASISSNRVSGQAGTTVFQLSAASSTDPDSDPLTYQWDLLGTGGVDATGVTTTHMYAQAGTYRLRLRVTDNKGASDDAFLTVNVSNTPPVASIVTPAAGRTWRVGNQIAFSGTGTDAEDGVLAPAAPGRQWEWALVLHHCPTTCHQHVEATWTGASGGSFTTPDHEYPAFLELVLTVTDSTGTSASDSIELYPETSTVTLVTNPPGLSVVAGISPAAQASPVTIAGIEWGKVSVSAVSPQMVNGREYVFSSWSDGGTRSHDINFQKLDRIYTATFVPRSASGSSVGFSGDDGVSVGDVSGLAGDVSFEFWVKRAPSSVRRNVLGKAYAGEGLVTVEPSGRLTFYQGDGGGNGWRWEGLRSTGSVPVGSWSHVVVTRSGQVVRMYVNGVLDSTRTFGRVASDSSLPLVIGDGYLAGFEGWLDEVAVYRRALTAVEVGDHYGAVSDAVVYGSVVMGDSPAGFWRLDEAAGLVAVDEVGSWPGTYQGTPTLAAPGARLAWSVGFSGDDGVSVGDVSGLAGDVSFEFWVKRAPSSVRRNVLGKAYAGEGLVTVEPSGRLTFYQGDGGGNGWRWEGLRSTGSVPVGSWSHVVVTRSGQVVRMYVNGVLDSTRTFGRVASDSSLPLVIGDGYLAGFEGWLDEVAVYRRALTAVEVGDHYGAVSDAVVYGSVVMGDSPAGFWRLDEAAGLVAVDEVGSWPGTYQGTPTLAAPGAR